MHSSAGALESVDGDQLQTPSSLVLCYAVALKAFEKLFRHHALKLAPKPAGTPAKNRGLEGSYSDLHPGPLTDVTEECMDNVT